MYRQSALQEIEDTIRLAEVRCLPFDALLQRLSNLWSDPYAAEIVHRVATEPFSHNEMAALATVAEQLAETADGLPSSRKASVDRALKRILARMPPDLAAPIATPWLEHKRKFRRQIAYKVLRASGLPDSYGPKLLGIFRRTGDQECLLLIARNPRALQAAAPQAVFSAIDDEYWRMRVVEGMGSLDPAAAEPFAKLAPREFAWAAGRLRDRAFLPALRQLFVERPEDLEFRSIYAWALGQLEALEDLLSLRQHLALKDVDLDKS
jgi:hypothetical protein